jgi:hypothetical protein
VGVLNTALTLLADVINPVPTFLNGGQLIAIAALVYHMQAAKCRGDAYKGLLLLSIPDGPQCLQRVSLRLG